MRYLDSSNYLLVAKGSIASLFLAVAMGCTPTSQVTHQVAVSPPNVFIVSNPQPAKATADGAGELAGTLLDTARVDGFYIESDVVLLVIEMTTGPQVVRLADVKVDRDNRSLALRVLATASQSRWQVRHAQPPIDDKGRLSVCVAFFNGSATRDLAGEIRSATGVR